MARSRLSARRSLTSAAESAAEEREGERRPLLDLCMSASFRGLDVADLNALTKGRERVGTLGDELLGNEALEAGIDDGLHDGGIIQLLRIVDFIAPRHATGVVMGDIGSRLANGSDHIALHDLH